LPQGAHELARLADFILVEQAIGVGVELADGVLLGFIAGGAAGRFVGGWLLGDGHG
jgi:hypothetical protein